LNEDRKWVGSLPLSALTPEMIANPRLVLESPAFLRAEDFPMVAGEDEDDEDEWGHEE
jgi:hypothetical protein